MWPLSNDLFRLLHQLIFLLIAKNFIIFDETNRFKGWCIVPCRIILGVWRPGTFLMQVIWRPRNASHQCQTRIIGRQKHLFQYRYIWREDQSQQHCQIKSNWSPRNLRLQNWPWQQFAQSHKLVSLNLDFLIVAWMHLQMIQCDFWFFFYRRLYRFKYYHLI